MENKKDKKKEAYEKKVLMLSEEDIDMQQCYRHLLPEQKSALISFVYEISLVLYNSYSKKDESS